MLKFSTSWNSSYEPGYKLCKVMEENNRVGWKVHKPCKGRASKSSSKSFIENTVCFSLKDHHNLKILKMILRITCAIIRGQCWTFKSFRLGMAHNLLR